MHVNVRIPVQDVSGDVLLEHAHKVEPQKRSREICSSCLLIIN